MKFYTGQGDGGQSTLFGSGAKISKTDPRFEALGALDELNSYLGVCKSLAEEEKVKNILKTTQENLFIIQAEIGSPNAKKVSTLSESKLKDLEKTIDEFGNFVGEIRQFTVAGGLPLSAHFDFARALARKAERRAAALKNQISPTALAYLNRLSSLLFVLARYVNKKTNTPEDHPSYK
ncbi:MAG: cob(I)yrinic acid a,c-diamide adenosyltransferase [Candidatus Giovannonibacteria bacterium]|nr:cob(I)yrinic acid a,c-diamide adenosyltransferase [Candidatus Giovannonibacteria bacterium]